MVFPPRLPALAPQLLDDRVVHLRGALSGVALEREIGDDQLLRLAAARVLQVAAVGVHSLDVAGVAVVRVTAGGEHERREDREERSQEKCRTPRHGAEPYSVNRSLTAGGVDEGRRRRDRPREPELVLRLLHAHRGRLRVAAGGDRDTAGDPVLDARPEELVDRPGAALALADRPDQNRRRLRGVPGERLDPTLRITLPRR